MIMMKMQNLRISRPLGALPPSPQGPVFPWSLMP